MVVSPRDEQALAAADRPRRRAQTWLFTLALVALVAGTVVGVVVARHRALESVERRAEEAAARAAALVETELARALSGLSGASAVVAPDGSLDTEAFSGFAADLLDTGEVGTLLLAAVQEEGTEPVRYPVLATVSEVPAPSRVGDDLGRDPTRRAAIRLAVRTHAPAVSQPLDLLLTGEQGIAVIRPLLWRAGPEPVARGVVATGIPLARLDRALQEAVGADAEVALVDSETPLVGPTFERRAKLAAAAVDVPGQRWTVAARHTGDPDFTVAWLLAVGGAAAIATMAALLLVTVRHQRRLADANAALVRGQERTRAGQEVAGRLARALSGSDVAAALFDHLPAAVGARSVVIATMDRGGALRVLGRDDTPDAEHPALGRPAPGSVVDSVLSRGEPAWLVSPLGWRNDELTTSLAAGGSALAVLPLAADEVVGVIAVAYPQFHIFADDEQALLQTVAVLAAQALARGRRYDAEHLAAVAFQRAALPDALPDLAGVTIAARYQPATHGATVGGDWYDVLPLEDDRVLLVVGDVVGHGMEAAAAMGRLRTAFQTVVAFDDDPAAVLRAVSQQVDAIPDAFAATVLAALVDLRTGEMRWCRAGHPPPLVLSAAGHELLDEPGLPPLGVAPDLAPPVHCRKLVPGERLVLYTDGVVERRDESLDRSFRRLGVVAEQLADLHPEEFCDALVEAMVPADEQADDLAVLVMRFEGA